MRFLATDALARARRVRMVIFDVDGVLTDGRLWYGPGGEELKAFHAFDGHRAGHGAAREVCEFILEAQGKLGTVLARFRR